MPSSPNFGHYDDLASKFSRIRSRAAALARRAFRHKDSSLALSASPMGIERKEIAGADPLSLLLSAKARLFRESKTFGQFEIQSVGTVQRAVASFNLS